jgi:bifunctional UDP-N-acetylglucosamine pyrophosphorylase/glucosamine-1-phosphate N-acetyltransferase
MPVKAQNNGMKPTRAILLAAGQGKRMKSTLPKVLHEVLGKTILGRVLASVDALGVEHVHIVIGHEAKQVEAFLSANPPKTPYSIHLQKEQQGTGHAVMQVIPALESFEGTLLISVADTPLLSAGLLKQLIGQHQEEKAAATMLTAKVDDPKNYGRVLRDKAGKVVGIIEDKDATNEEKHITEINTAIYCFEWPKVKKGLMSLTNNNKQKEYYLPDLIGWTVKDELPVAAVITPDWREVAGINSRIELAEATRLLRDATHKRLALESGVTILDPQNTWISPEVQIGQDAIILPHCYLIGDIEIGEGCRIGPATSIYGHTKVGAGSSVSQSVIIDSQVGKHCRIGPFAHLRNGSVVNDDSRIGNYVEIKKSSIGRSTNVSHLSYVGDATIGSGVNIGAGTITANYDHLTKMKYPTIIGNGVSTGCNAVLIAPVTVGENAVVAAGTVVTKEVPAESLAVGRARQENKEGWTKSRRAKTKSEKK